LGCTRQSDPSSRPWRGLDDVEFATLEWVSWDNTSRLMEPLGYLPPKNTRGNFTTPQRLNSLPVYSHNELSEKPGTLHPLKDSGALPEHVFAAVK
jgi:hypothetical protein